MRNSDDILNTKVTAVAPNNGWYGGSYQQRDVTVKCCLCELPWNFMDNINKVRSYPYHSDEQRNAKVKLVPSFLLSGTYPDRKLCDDDILTKANLLAVDIDFIDNPDMNVDELRNTLFNLPYVFGVYKSVSNKGLFAIIAIEDTMKTIKYVPEISRVWKKLYNINIDTNCKNIARKRFVSFDPEWGKYTKFNTMIEEWDREFEFEEIKQSDTHKVHRVKFEDNSKNKQCLSAHDIAKYIISKGFTTDNVNEWFAAACNLYNEEDGELLFIQLSRQSQNYKSDSDCIKTFKSAKKYANSDNIKYWIGKAKKMLGNEWWSIIIKERTN